MNLYRLVFIVILFNSCSVKELSSQYRVQKINLLANLITHLDVHIDKNEAYELSQSSINYSQKLAKKYEAIASPWIQNALVNIGIKKRGLCHEWSEDLLRYLLQKNYRTLKLHAVGANIGYMSEHNALAVSAKGEGINNSILLDAWRNSGDLYFKKIHEDKKYDWIERKGLYGVRR